LRISENTGQFNPAHPVIILFRRLNHQHGILRLKMLSSPDGGRRAKGGDGGETVAQPPATRMAKKKKKI